MISILGIMLAIISPQLPLLASYLPVRFELFYNGNYEEYSLLG
jgi:hypothetical protein